MADSEYTDYLACPGFNLQQKTYYSVNSTLKQVKWACYLGCSVRRLINTDENKKAGMGR